MKSDISDELQEGQCVGSCVLTSVDARLMDELPLLLEEDMVSEDEDDLFEDELDDDEHEEKLLSEFISLGDRDRECQADS